MQASTIVSIIANVILSFSLLSMLVGPRVISYIKKRKKLKERQRVKEIEGIVNSYLDRLKND